MRVLVCVLFIINERASLPNMKRRIADLEPYQAAIQRWIPKAEITLEPKPLAAFDAVITLKKADEKIRYLVEAKPHLRHQDVGIVIIQLNHLQMALPHPQPRDRILLLAPHVRRQQAVALEEAGIDYLDLAGNVHLNAPGLFVHVEGRLPTKELPAPGRPQKGWIKTVMAILVRPQLVDATYRVIADEAGVALGTVGTCMKDLERRGLMLDRKAGRTIPDRRGLVALWVQAYVDVLRPKLKERRFQVRAANKEEIWARLQAAFAQHGTKWALTGADAANRRAHFFRAEETEIYANIRVLDTREFLQAVQAQPAIRNGNLLAIEIPGPLAMPTRPDENIPATPDLLAYAELRYRGTGQAMEAAEMLLPRILEDDAH
jgi:hypothetical protein